MNYDHYVKMLRDRINRSRYSVQVSIYRGRVPLFYLGEHKVIKVPVPFSTTELAGMMDTASNYSEPFYDTIVALGKDVQYCLNVFDRKTKYSWTVETHKRNDSLDYITDEAISLLVG